MLKYEADSLKSTQKRTQMVSFLTDFFGSFFAVLQTDNQLWESQRVKRQSLSLLLSTLHSMLTDVTHCLTQFYFEPPLK